jgi:hypothetical protein
MATTLQIPGPSVIYTSVNNGTAWDLLGYSDNDNLPSVAFTDNMHEVRTVLSGAEPEQVVLTGTSARISLALVKWDQDFLEELLTHQRRGVAQGNTQGRTTVGRLLVATSGYGFVQVRIQSVSGAGRYTFNCAYLVSDGVADSQWGNRERVLALNFKAIQRDSTTNLYTYEATFTP